jgi:thymidylate kinase
LILILEGPDGAGKTTLGVALSKELGWPFYQCPRTPIEKQTVAESQAEDRAAIALALCVSDHVNVIFDRSFPSEWVYGQLLDREFDHFEVFTNDASVSRDGGLGFVLHYSNPADAWTRADGHVDADQLIELQRLYDEYVVRSAMEWAWLDASKSKEDILKDALRLLRKMRNLPRR